MKEQTMLFWTSKKVALLLSSIMLLGLLAGCAQKEPDPLVVPFVEGPSSPPSVVGPDGPPPSS